jgi:hypothetical protein
MRRLLIMAALLAGLVPTGTANSTGLGDEGCRAMNPITPRCSYKVTHTSGTPITGVYGVGNWVVKVRRGGRTDTYQSLPDGRPTLYEIAFKVGDRVTGIALTPGSALEVGHVD